MYGMWEKHVSKEIHIGHWCRNLKSPLGRTKYRRDNIKMD
jgi:hypothetical protein